MARQLFLLARRSMVKKGSPKKGKGCNKKNRPCYARRRSYG